MDAKKSLIERYRNAAPQINAPLNDVVRTILSHRSVRRFTNETISEDALRQIVAAAQSAATSSNLQAWSVIAVRDPARKNELMKLCDDQSFIGSAPVFLVWCADLSRARRIAGDKNLEGADYVEAFLISVIDVAIAAQNAAVAAESMGLGICYVGALRNEPEKVAALLDFPSGVFGVFGMALGHPDPAKPAAVRPRLPQEAVLHFESYDAEKEAPAIASFNATQNAFQSEQGMKVIDWTDRVAARLKDAEALDGRDTLRNALQKMGFALR